MKKVCILTTIPATLHYFQREQIHTLQTTRHTVTLLTGEDPWVPSSRLREWFDGEVITVCWTRRLGLVRDMRALLQVYRAMRLVRPGAVNYSTPKASLIGAVAAFAARVPCRVYTLRGIFSCGHTGWRRFVAELPDRITCALSHKVIAVSESNRRYAVARGFAPEGKIVVLGRGSSHGVDAEGVFNPGAVSVRRRGEFRARFGIPDGALVYGFVGRLSSDKGLGALVQAWESVAGVVEDGWCVVVGPSSEPGDVKGAEMVRRLKELPRVVMTGACDDMPVAYGAMDVLVHPSRREGFPNAVLEAAAMERPAITTDALGCIDAVKDGETGMVVPVDDGDALAGAMETLGRDHDMRKKLGTAARRWVLRDFNPAALAHQFAAIFK